MTDHHTAPASPSSETATEALTAEERTLLQDLARGCHSTGPELVAIAKAIRICDVSSPVPAEAPSEEAVALRAAVESWRSGAAELTRQADALDERIDRMHTVHLRRHQRLSEAVGIDPGYSADATIDKAIELIRAARSTPTEATND